jgi:hypothetical protein
LLQRALELLAGGFALRRAAVCELTSGRFDARLLVTATPAAPKLGPATLRVTQLREPRAARVELVLAR